MSWTAPPAWTASLVTVAQMQILSDDLNQTVRPLYTSGSGVQDINTSITQTSILEGGFTIPGNTIGAKGSLLGIVQADYLNNTAGASNLTLSVGFGVGTASIRWGDLRSMAQGATRVPQFLIFALGNVNATNSQALTGFWHAATGPGTAASVAGTFRFDSMYSFAATFAVDTTSATILDVSVTHGTSSASISFRRHKATVLLVPST